LVVVDDEPLRRFRSPEFDRPAGDVSRRYVPEAVVVARSPDAFEEFEILIGDGRKRRKRKRIRITVR